MSARKHCAAGRWIRNPRTLRGLDASGPEIALRVAGPWIEHPVNWIRNCRHPLRPSREPRAGIDTASCRQLR